MMRERYKKRRGEGWERIDFQRILLWICTSFCYVITGKPVITDNNDFYVNYINAYEVLYYKFKFKDFIITKV